MRTTFVPYLRDQAAPRAEDLARGVDLTVAFYANAALARLCAEAGRRRRLSAMKTAYHHRRRGRA